MHVAKWNRENVSLDKTVNILPMNKQNHLGIHGKHLRLYTSPALKFSHSSVLKFSHSSVLKFSHFSVKLCCTSSLVQFRSSYSMRGIVVFLAVVSVAVGLAGTWEGWHLWQQRHKKVYLNESEEASRKQIWLRNLLKISDHNSRNLTFVMELNQFADLVSL